MRLLLLIGVSFFCFDQVILMSTGRTEGENNPGEILESKPIQLRDQMNNKTELMDLNDDCLLLVFEQLDFASLLSVADVNYRYKTLVSGILKGIIREKKVDITLENFSNYFHSDAVSIKNDLIGINHLAIAERLVKNFGNFIQKLEIKNYCFTLDEPARSIYRLVSLHCSKTLTEITLTNSLHNYLDEFTNAFENVQNVNIRYDLATKCRLNETFPAVRQLEILVHSVLYPESINGHYKQLEDLRIHVYPNKPFLSEQWAADLISNNPQIRSLTLEKSSGKYIKIAADSIPQLERLDLNSMQTNFKNEIINFKNVKELIVTGTYDILNQNINFGNVEEVTLYSLPGSLFGETGFFKSNTNLKKFRLMPDHVWRLNTDEFRQFANTPTTFQDIFIGGAYDFELRTFLALINNNRQLERVEIEFLQKNFQQAALEELRREIADTWTIDEFENNLILKKKEISA